MRCSGLSIRSTARRNSSSATANSRSTPRPAMRSCWRPVATSPRSTERNFAMASPASTTRTSWRAAWQPDMTHPPIPAATRETCDECSKNLEAARKLVLHAEISQDPAVRAQGLYLLQMLQAFGFNIYVAPRQAYPNFYLHSIFMPFESGFGAPCPDFFYRWA